MLKIAYFSPLPPERTGIAGYSWDLLPYLAQSAEITLFHPTPQQIDPLPYPTYPLDRYPDKRWEFDLPIYHMGNSPFHRGLYEMFKRHPGVVVLHDLVLHHFMASEQYGRELSYALGVPHGMTIRMQGDSANLNKFPLNRRVLDVALGVIVHSRYAAQQIAATHPNLPTAVIPMPMMAMNAAEKPKQPLTFGCLGQVTPAKQVDFALRAFGRFHTTHPDSRFHIVGDSADYDLAAIISQLPPAAQEAIYIHGYAASQAEFEAQIEKLDIVINLRYPTSGETSAAALRAIAHGKPVLVFNHGTYSELPDSVAIKTPVMDADALLAAMQQMASQLNQFVAAARPYITEVHHPQISAESTLAFLNQIFNTPTQIA